MKKILNIDHGPNYICYRMILNHITTNLDAKVCIYFSKYDADKIISDATLRAVIE